MLSIEQRLQIAAAWLLSFVRGKAQPEHYPISVRMQHGVAADSTWFAQVLNWPGPCGLGATRQEAKNSLLKNLRQIAATRWSNGQPMPRPGTGLPVEFASTKRVDQYSELLDDFIVHVLGFTKEDPVFISDDSSLADFGDEDEVEQLRGRLIERYGVELAPNDSLLIADILVRVHARNEA